MENDTLPSPQVGLEKRDDCNPLPQYLPVTLEESHLIQNVHTDCWVQLFRDMIVVGVSQLPGGRVGTYVLCQVEEVTFDSKLRCHTSTVLGVRNDTVIWEVYARRLTELLATLRKSQSDPMPSVLLGISLQSETSQDMSMFSEVIDILEGLYKKAVEKVIM
jgi:Proteasome assembly chaperone 3